MTTTAPRRRITRAQVARLRLHSLGLVPGSGEALATPLAVVEHHLAMQGQDWGASRWAVGSRIAGSTDADVLAAYDRGEIVRSWPMRGTVHVVPAADIGWMLDLMGVRALAGVEGRWERLGITGSMLEAARAVAVELLRGGRSASRAELVAAVLDAGIDMSGQRNYNMVWYLSQTGTLVMGPTRDGEQLLVLREEWITTPHTPGREAALRRLGERYFAARGPASVDDLAHWSKLTKTDCRAAVEANRDDFVELEADGQVLYMPAERFDRSGDAKVPAALALTAFDEHLLGYRVRDAVLDPDKATLVDPGRNGVFRRTMVLGGRVAGTWSQQKRAKSVKVTLTPFAPLSAAATKAATRALERYGDFAGSPVVVDVAAPAGVR